MGRITVRKLPKDPGPAAWNALLPPPAAAQRVEGRQTADWVVIGAGFAGLAAARRLSQLAPSERIVVLEARRVAEGPGGRNSGFMIDLPHDLSSSDYGGALARDRLTTADNRHAIAFATEMARAFNLPQEALRPSGKINAAATDKGLARNQSYAAHLAEMGETHELLNAQEMRELTGIEYYKGGLFTPGAAILQPAMYLRHVAAGLRSNRVQIFEDSPVTGLEQQGDWVISTGQGRITAPNVILAVNGHLNSFGFARGRLMHVFTYASMTRALTPEEVTRLGGAADWGVTPADPMGTTVRRISGTGGDRIVIRNRFTYEPSLEASERRISAAGRDHDRAFAARFPMLKGVEMDYRWGGRLCLSRNDVSLVGSLAPGLYSACVQNGLGTARGTLSGLLAAEHACGVKSPRLARALAQPQPSKLPPEPLASLGARTVLTWQHFRAGAEM